MRILIAGDWHSELHEEPIFKAFQELGHSACRFEWFKYFKSGSKTSIFKKYLLKAQNKYMFGPVNNKLNKDLIKKCVQSNYDLLFIYRGSHIYKKTLNHIHKKSPKTKIIGYNNDDPFSNKYPKWMWRHYLDCLPYYDLVLAYRTRNLAQLRSHGAKNVNLLRSWFIPEKNFPITLTEKENETYSCDVVFIGHYENDGRLESLEQIVKAGFSLKLYGHGYGWNKPLLNSSIKYLAPVSNLWGADYNKALNGAKIALCFLSKLNMDTYTRRCFEIPACGTLLLSEYSSDLEAIFEPDVEAVYFQNNQELIKKLTFYLSNSNEREKIAKSGYEKVWSGHHDVYSRAQQIIALSNSII